MKVAADRRSNDDDDDVDDFDESLRAQSGFAKMSKSQIMSGITTPGLGSPQVCGVLWCVVLVVVLVVVFCCMHVCMYV